MSSRVKRSISRITVSLIAVTLVFGLASLMVLKQYDATVIIPVVTGTCLAAAELACQLQESTSTPSELDHTPEERS
jgi:hypothetical protein